MIDYKEKIKKLLSLATSSNEHEAQAAMAKAQQLMVEHNIALSDVQNVDKNALKRDTDIVYSPRKNPWILSLSNLIAMNYRCSTFVEHDLDKPQTRHLSFVGMEEDLEICLIVFNYALDCITSEINTKKKHLKSLNMSQKNITSACNGYAYGFIQGLHEMFEEQKKEFSELNKKWELVVCCPPEVNKKLQELGSKRTQFNSKQSNYLSKNDYDKGKKDGKDCDITKRVITK